MDKSGFLIKCSIRLCTVAIKLSKFSSATICCFCICFKSGCSGSSVELLWLWKDLAFSVSNYSAAKISRNAVSAKVMTGCTMTSAIFTSAKSLPAAVRLTISRSVKIPSISVSYMTKIQLERVPPMELKPIAESKSGNKQLLPRV